MRRARSSLVAVVGALTLSLGLGAGVAAKAQTASVPAGRARPDAFTPEHVRFMSGMIGHHAQAILMADWAETHSRNERVRTLARIIRGTQTDEIAFMQAWLEDRGQPVPPADPRGHVMAGMDHVMLMPGMLTPDEMKALEVARGADFDRLFLTGMIMHHQGAIGMVDELFASPGVGQDKAVFKFANDVVGHQASEIWRMNAMLLDMEDAAR